MATKLMANFTSELLASAPALAQAQDVATVKEIVDDAEARALRRTPIPNTFVYKSTVVVLGLCVILVVIAQFTITYVDKDIPEGLIAIGSAAVGALAGLLAPQPAS